MENQFPPGCKKLTEISEFQMSHAPELKQQLDISEIFRCSGTDSMELKNYFEFQDDTCYCCSVCNIVGSMFQPTIYSYVCRQSLLQNAY